MASTQMAVHNTPGVQFLEQQGFARVVLARETSLESIRNIKASTDVELEVFVHGALCVAYSGQCLLSSMIGGRSGNRGLCAQPCPHAPIICLTRAGGNMPMNRAGICSAPGI